jgi:hypothetical protein
MAALAGAAPALAQDPEQTSILVILDANSIDQGPPPHELPSELVNDAIAGAGVREELPYFAARVGQLGRLRGGEVGNSAWFALKSTPESWNSDPAAHDGLSNFVLAGAGVGSPDATGDRESHLRQVPDVVPLQAAGLGMLVGQQVCGVIYDREVSILSGNPTDLTGPTLGILAFKVVRLIEPATITALPNVEVEIVEAHEVCHGPLTAFVGAPDPDGQR